jgi:hypothetical protein
MPVLRLAVVSLSALSVDIVFSLCVDDAHKFVFNQLVRATMTHRCPANLDGHSAKEPDFTLLLFGLHK